MNSQISSWACASLRPLATIAPSPCPEVLARRMVSVWLPPLACDGCLGAMRQTHWHFERSIGRERKFDSKQLSVDGVSISSLTEHETSLLQGYQWMGKLFFQEEEYKKEIPGK